MVLEGVEKSCIFWEKLKNQNQEIHKSTETNLKRKKQ